MQLKLIVRLINNSLNLRNIRIFLQYFNNFGLFHIALPLLVDSILLYNMFEIGFDVLFAGVWMAFFIQICIGAFFAQLLSKYVSSFVFFLQ